MYTFQHSPKIGFGEANMVVNEMLKDMQFVDVCGVSFHDVESVTFENPKEDEPEMCLVVVNLKGGQYATATFYTDDKVMVDTMYSGVNVMNIVIQQSEV